MDLFGSREIGEVKDGVNRVETRLGRQCGISNGGARQVARLIEWSEKRDERIRGVDAPAGKAGGEGNSMARTITRPAVPMP